MPLPIINKIVRPIIKRIIHDDASFTNPNKRLNDRVQATEVVTVQVSLIEITDVGIGTREIVAAPLILVSDAVSADDSAIIVGSLVRVDDTADADDSLISVGSFVDYSDLDYSQQDYS